MFPLLGVEVLQLGGVLVLALVGRVRPGVELVLGLDGKSGVRRGGHMIKGRRRRRRRRLLPSPRPTWWH